MEFNFRDNADLMGFIGQMINNGFPLIIIPQKNGFLVQIPVESEEEPEEIEEKPKKRRKKGKLHKMHKITWYISIIRNCVLKLVR